MELFFSHIDNQWYLLHMLMLEPIRVTVPEARAWFDAGAKLLL